MRFSAGWCERLCGVFAAALCVSLVGCGAGVSSNGSLAGGALRGHVHGGQQPIVGASIQLYAAGATGYGSSATPLLSSAVTTDASGSFSITGGYTCPSSTSQLYIVATGGNPGLTPGTNNAASALMTALGPCSLNGGQYTLDPNSFISINEVTTVASVYALSAFMGGDATHVGTSNTNAVGLANSFAIVNNLVNTTSGAALATTPAGNGTAPQAAVNTLGNVLASCVNSTGVGSPCSALFGNATPVGGGTTPTDTIQAIYDIARNPANNVSALYALASATPPFQPTLSPAPNDWMLAVTYSGGSPTGMAIDASGNAWFTNAVYGGPYSVSELNSNGAVLSGTNGYTGGGLTVPTGIAIDPTGNVWVSGTGNVLKLSSTGTILSGANGYTGGGLNKPQGIALDGQGAAWVPDFGSNSVIKLDNNGNILSGASGFSTGASSAPAGVGIDVAGNAWVGNNTAQTVTELSSNGSVISGSGGYPTTGNFSPGMVAFDASGNVWLNTNLTNSQNLNNVMKLSSTGTQLSPSGGYPNCVSPGVVGAYVITCLWWDPDAFAIDGAGNVWGEMALETKENGRVPNPMFYTALSKISNTGTILSPANGFTGQTLLGSGGSSGGAITSTIAIDGGGNVWVLFSAGPVAEFVGAATPVVTPFSLGVKNGTLGQRP
jgi:sugar lactone lactonase YvrE